MLTLWPRLVCITVALGFAMLLSFADVSSGVAAELESTADETDENIESLRQMGVLIRECSLPGETRNDQVVPRHASAIQISRDRWLVLYSTHGYRGIDDERSIVYQIRRDQPDGQVVKEDFLAKEVFDWRPEGAPAPPKNHVWCKQHEHMVAFGVPKDAAISSSGRGDAGTVPSHANVFAVMWRTIGRPYDVKRNYLERADFESAMTKFSTAVEWMQFRLNDRGDDIEILQPVKILRQKGFETGTAFCSLPDAAGMQQTICPPIPLNESHTEWGMCEHFRRGRLAVVKLRFNPTSQLYEWVETGPWIATRKHELSEASLVRVKPNEWLISARNNSGIVWASSQDPLKSWSRMAFSHDPFAEGYHATFVCGDGVLRMLSGDPAESPSKSPGDPLYLLELEPGTPAHVLSRRVVFDTVAEHLPIRKLAVPRLDLAEMFPHFGRTQLVVYGVCTRAFNVPASSRIDVVSVNEKEIDAAGIYYSKITYQNERYRFGILDDSGSNEIALRNRSIMRYEFSLKG